MPEAERNVELLLGHLLGCAVTELVLRARDELGDDTRERYESLLASRVERRPLQHLLGEWEFFGLTLEVSPAALIPRAETETLVDALLARLPPGARRVVDVGTGTGCIALALAHARPELDLVATDRSPAALALAARNLARHGLGGRVELVEGDLFEPLVDRVEPGSVDAVVSNPPYVAAGDIDGLEPEVREHDPRLALDGGADGLEVVRRLIAGAGRWVRRGGLLALEIGAGQADEVTSVLTRSGRWRDVERVPDLAGSERVIVATRS